MIVPRLSTGVDITQRLAGATFSTSGFASGARISVVRELGAWNTAGSEFKVRCLVNGQGPFGFSTPVTIPVGGGVAVLTAAQLAAATAIDVRQDTAQSSVSPVYVTITIEAAEPQG